MTQPNYPIESEVHGATTALDMAQLESDEPPVKDDIPEIVYIVEGTQIGYGKRIAWQ